MNTPPSRVVSLAAFALAAAAMAGSASGQWQFVGAQANIPALGGATEAAKFGDWDLDGDLDLLYANGGDLNNQQSRLLVNKGLAQGGVVGTYMDVTATKLLPNFTQSSRDVQVADIDGDGDLDLYFSNHSSSVLQSSTFFVNKGLAQGGTIGEFQRDMSRWVGVGASGSSVPGSLVLTTGSFAGGWVDWSCQCEFADVDLDDDLDLLHSSYGPSFLGTVMSRLFLNGFDTSPGSFREYNPSGAVSGNPTLPAGSPAGFVEGVQANDTADVGGAQHDLTSVALDVDFADLDGDLDVDIHANSRDTQSRMYQNRWNENGESLGDEGAGTRLYRDVTGGWLLGPGGLANAGVNYDGDVNDIDNDEDIDVYFINYTAGTTDVYGFNNGAGNQVNFATVPNSSADDNEVDWIDYDHDGDVDAHISAFSSFDRMYRNNFVETTAVALTEVSSIMQNAGTGTLAADMGDIDNDGDQDIIKAKDGGLHEVLLRNTLDSPDPIAPRVPRTTQLASGAPSAAPRLVVAQVHDNANLEYFTHASGVLHYTVDGVPHTAPVRYAGGNLWTGRIPGYWTGAIAYAMSITDRAGNTGTSAPKFVTIPPAGLSSYGAGTPGCSGPQVLGANSAPTIGNPDFAITCTSAPPSSLGLLLIADVPSAGSDPFGLGISLHVDLLSSTLLLAADSFGNPSGVATAPLPLPYLPSAAGASVFLQQLNVWTSCSPSPLNLSSSNGLAVTFLP